MVVENAFAHRIYVAYCILTLISCITVGKADIEHNVVSGSLVSIASIASLAAVTTGSNSSGRLRLGGPTICVRV